MFDVIYMIDYVAIGLTVVTLVYLGITTGFLIHEVYLRLTKRLKASFEAIMAREYPAEKLDKRRYDFAVTSIAYMTTMLVSTVALMAFTSLIGNMLVSGIALNSNHYYSFDIYTYWIILTASMLYVFIVLARRGELHDTLTKFLSRDLNPFKRKEGKPVGKLNSDVPTSSNIASQQVPNPNELIPNWTGQYAKEPADKPSEKPGKSLIPDWTGMFANMTKNKPKKVVEQKKTMELTEEESLIIQKMRIEERMVQEALKKKGVEKHGE